MLVFPFVRGPREAGSGRTAFKNCRGTISFPVSYTHLDVYKRPVYTGDSCYVDDGSPTCLFPDAGSVKHSIEAVRIGHQVDRIQTHGDQEFVYRTAGDGEQGEHQGVHDDPAHEVRKVNNGLNGLFEFLMMKLVQKECQDDRNRESDCLLYTSRCV